MYLPGKLLELRVVCQMDTRGNPAFTVNIKCIVGQLGGLDNTEVHVQGLHGVEVGTHGDRGFAVFDSVQSYARHPRSLRCCGGADAQRFAMRTNLLAHCDELVGSRSCDDRSACWHSVSYSMQID